MKNFKNPVPIYTEQIINGEKNIQETLAQFKQLVPINFIQLETRGKNYMCSTQGWKEPACERYIFFDNNNKSVQLDIPQELMTELELEKGQDIPYPLHVSPTTLSKELSFGAITIKDKKEIFIQKPLTEKNLEPELTKWLTELKKSREKISQLTITEKLSQELAQEIQLLKTELQGEKQLSKSQSENQKNRIKLLQDKLQEKENKIRELEGEKERLNNDYQNSQQQLNQKNNEITRLRNKIGDIERERDNRPTQQQLSNIQQELEIKTRQLQKELSWWDKWFSAPLIKNLDVTGKTTDINVYKVSTSLCWSNSEYLIEEGENFGDINTERARKIIFMIYQYYRDK